MGALLSEHAAGLIAAVSLSNLCQACHDSRGDIPGAFSSPCSSAPTGCVDAQAAFRLGIFSSSSPYTVSNVVPMLRAAAGPSPQLLFGDPALNLDRRCTMDAPASHKASGGKAWDTVKPLHQHFRRLDRVVLVDDDAFKVLRPETLLMGHMREACEAFRRASGRELAARD